MKKVGQYDILEIIGDGGMGAVYKGRDPRFDRPVAIKVLHPQLTRQAEVVERFKSEAVIQAKLNHPHIVNVLDFVTERDTLAIVMELVDGRSVDQMLQEEWRSMPASLAVTVCRHVLWALGYAHASGLVHRDVKPSNVIVARYGARFFSKVGDFGVAKILGAEKLKTATGAKMGTLQYMSPEHIKSPKYVDQRSDVYSAGVMLYQMLTGSLPFDGETEFETMKQIVEDVPPPPSTLAGRVPDRLDAIIASALAKDPNERYRTAQEFDDALAEVEQASAARRGASTRRVPQPPTQVVVERVVEEREKEVAVTPIWVGPAFGLLVIACSLLALAVANTTASVSRVRAEAGSAAGVAAQRIADLESQVRTEKTLRAKAAPLTFMAADSAVRNEDQGSRPLSAWTTTFHRANVRFIQYRVTFQNNLQGLKSAGYSLWVKYVRPDGTVNRNPRSSPPGFTMKTNLWADQGSPFVEDGRGWGNAEVSAYQPGTHRIEFYLQPNGSKERKRVGDIRFTVVE